MWPAASECPRKQKWGSHIARMSGCAFVRCGVNTNPRTANRTQPTMRAGPATGARRAARPRAPADGGPALVERLRDIARSLRVTDIEMLTKAGSGHPGGTLSAADLVTALYFHRLRVRPEEPHWPDRDRFVLSKGHCIPIVYAALAKRGFFPEDE